MLKGFSKIAEKECEEKEDKKEEKLEGGRADKEPDSKFNKKELKRGAKHEGEHTDDKDAKKEIAKDHLKEDPKYYQKLEKMEKKSSVLGTFCKVAAAIIRAPVGTNRVALKAPTQAPSVSAAINNFNSQRNQIRNYQGTPASRKVQPISPSPAATATPTTAQAPGAK